MYNDIIIDNFSDPQNVGELDSPDMKFEIGNPVCGDRIQVHLDMNEGVVNQACFRAWGCATSVATANIFCSNITGKSIDQIRLVEQPEMDVMLGDLEPSQHHCLHILHELYEAVSA
jgi:nitrogen fixation NifU-like protein